MVLCCVAVVPELCLDGPVSVIEGPCFNVVAEGVLLFGVRLKDCRVSTNGNIGALMAIDRLCMLILGNSLGCGIIQRVLMCQHRRLIIDVVLT